MKILNILLSITIILIVSCASEGHKESKLSSWMKENEKKKILCTTAIVADLVKKVGNDRIDCLILIQGEHDPHSYQLVKGDQEKFQMADIIIFSGLGLEHDPSIHNQLHNNKKAFGLGDFILKSDPKSIIYLDNTLDPHIWMDIKLFSKSIPYIVQILSDLIPEHAKEFEQNGQRVTKDFQLLDQSIRKQLRNVPEQKRYLVTTHDAFNYFTRAYLAEEDELNDTKWLIRCQAPEGLSPESQLSTRDIKRLVDHIIKFRLGTVFAESNVSRDSIKKLILACKKEGQSVSIPTTPLYADAMGKEGSDGDSYPKMMEHNARTIAKELLK